MKFLGFEFLTKKEKIKRRIIRISITLIFILLFFWFGYLLVKNYYPGILKIMRGQDSAGGSELVDVFYNLLTEEKERTYLLLLQNNTELRPTGGFIGNYGILKIKQGKIQDFYIKDIYSLDQPAEQRLEIIPPEPLQKYFNRQKWWLRDINWSPDFPTTAHRAWAMYLIEGGQERIDGVVAINPEFIHDLLDLIGGLEIDGVKYTRDNFVDALEYEVEVGYIEDGKSKEERKVIIDKLGQRLKAELWPKIILNPLTFLDIIKQNIKEKNILAFSTYELLQNTLSQNNAAGELRASDSDYLMVVDANLGSLKTDPAVERLINYQVKESDEQLAVELNIDYNHRGGKDWKTSHYRTYTRIYVPLGAELISASGAMSDDTQMVGNFDIYSENNKTVFGAFVSINPEEQRSLSLKYILPKNISRQDYSLLLQKQPGNDYTNYDLDIFNKRQQGTLDSDKIF